VIEKRTQRAVRAFTLVLMRYKFFLPAGAYVSSEDDSADGTFDLVVEEPGRYALDVSATGLASHRTDSFSLEAGEVHDLGTIRLGDGGTIAGRVRDAQGRAVPFARINILNDKLQTNEQEPYTDADGAFEIAGISPGEYTVFAVSPQHPLGLVRGIKVEEAARTEVAVEFVAPAPLTVVVREAEGGGAIEGAELAFTFQAIQPLTSGLFRDKIPPGYGSHVSDAAGLIRQHSLPPGDVTLTIEAEGFRPWTDEVRLTAGEANRIEVRLKRK
jgi:hypothetical protein